MDRTIKIFIRVSGMFLLYGVIILIFAISIYMLTFGMNLFMQDIGSNKFDSLTFYTYNYESVFTILNTIFFMITTNNTPDMCLKDVDHRLLYLNFYLVVSAFNYIMAGGVILAVINNQYGKILVEEIETNNQMTDYHKDLLQ